MAKLKLSFACALYDRMQALYTGEVQPEGIELNFMAIEEPRPIFDRMSGGQEFDVAEYSSSEFVQRFANKQCPFVAIPVFPSRTAARPCCRCSSRCRSSRTRRTRP
jgi:4,5-dihydroxyphthalate decarboxylase